MADEPLNPPVEPTPSLAEATNHGYEFTEEQNREFAAVAGAFWVIGCVLGIQVVKQLYRAGVGTWQLVNGDATASWYVVAERVGLVIFLAPLAYWLLKVAHSFAEITLTSGRDIDHLMEGMRAIRSSYAWVSIPIFAAIIVGLVLIVVGWFR
jgi:hypothetical protein